ncbi:MAG TPA: type II toxin-antitoxin system RelE/ParE family toxin [Anaerolineales bacterium]|nr:type II toxin-antitoxin system RelE/ParE family toxin [Anaerolineales bacterium]
MIKSVRDKETALVFERERSPRLPPDIQQVAYRKLRMLNNAQSLADLRLPPGNHLEKLSGDREGQHSIRINERFRVCFRWREGDAYDVEIVDYH